MGRARLVLATIFVCACGGSIGVSAQSTPPPDGWVVLPVDEYRALREMAQPPGAPPAPPPVDATLTRVDYDLRIDGDSITGRALLTIDVLKDGWTRVQIPSGLMVRDARLDGQPLPLVEGPPPHVLLARAGRSLLTLDIVLPLASSAGTESVALPASPSPISRATLALPRRGVDLTPTGGFISEHTEGANESRWTAYGRPNQPLTLAWKLKVDDRRAEQPLRMRARLTEVAGLGEDSLQATVAVRIEVLHGLAREVALVLPTGLVVNQVNGPTIGDWDVSGGLLRVRFLDPLASEASFVVSGEARAPRDGAIVVPIVRMPAAERETGGIAVDVAGAGEISGRQALGLEPADPSELGDVVVSRESPSMIAFRHKPQSGAEARSLTVNVVRYTPHAVLVANVEEARYRVLASEDGRLLVQALWAIRNNQRSFLKVTLPADSTVWSAEVGGRPIRPGVAESDTVLLPLSKGRAGEEAPTFVVELMYLQRIEAWSDKARGRIELPALDLPISRTGLELHYSPRLRLQAEPGAFRLASDPGPFAEALRYTVPVVAEPAVPPMPSRDERAATLRTLVDQFKSAPGGRTVVGSLPVHVNFPTFGPSMFLASELTAEGRAPSIDLTFKRVRN